MLKREWWLLTRYAFLISASEASLPTVHELPPHRPKLFTNLLESYKVIQLLNMLILELLLMPIRMPRVASVCICVYLWLY